MDMEVDENEGASSVGQVMQEVKKLLWGNHIQEELFRRWSQGFIFSPDESTALVQKEGGPCAVIAPVQAFLLRAILRDPTLSRDSWRHMPSERVDYYLCQALTEILRQVALADSPLPPDNPPSTSTKLQLLLGQQAEAEGSGASAVVPPPQLQQVNVVQPSDQPQGHLFSIVFLNQPLSRRISCEVESELANGPQGPQDKRPHRTEEEIFHRNLRILQVENINQVENTIKEKLETFKGYYGILQFLYSVILTKGISKLSNEMSEPSELIDPVHGHGGQSLINLFLSGRGVSYVFDNDKDLGGLQLKGISRQCEVGFLTVLERLRYCEVGSFLKNPKYPIWVLGSETHLTVLFSFDMNLVKPESPAELARRVFKTFDPEGNNFIQSVLLEDVMKALGLFADTAYVEIMTKKLDPETLGIILLNDFMDEFYPNENYSGPDTFSVLHYNGLPRSSCKNKVVFSEGNAIVLETDVKSVSDENLLLTCLQTKWPNIDVQWSDGVAPSIN